MHSEWLEPLGLLQGPTAFTAMRDGLALPLQGGPFAFSLLREPAGTIIPPPEDHPALERLTRPIQPFAGIERHRARPLVMGIVNCTPDIPFPLMHNSIIRIPVYDHPSHAQKMHDLIKKKQVLETVHKHLWEGKTVLVHCHAGIQRSCAVVACYLVKYHGLTPDEAIAHIKKRRPIAFVTGVNFRETIEGAIDEQPKVAPRVTSFGSYTLGSD